MAELNRENIFEDLKHDVQNSGLPEAEVNQMLENILYYIIQHTPKEKRLVYINNASQNAEVWRDNDDLKDYSTEIKKSWIETVEDCAAKGADIGEEFGKIFGKTGEAIGRVAGGIIRAAYSAAKRVWDWLF